GLLHVGCGTVAGDLAEQVEGVGLMAPLLVGEGKVARLLGDGLGALSPPAHQKPVPEMRGPEREVRLDAELLAEGDALLEERQTFLDTPRENQGEAEDG